MGGFNSAFKIDGRLVGEGAPVYIVAEMSTNHGGSLSRAKEIIHAAYEAGADAVKLQTYTADTLTLNCPDEHFRIRGGLWDGQYLYDLYQSVAMPWEWHIPLAEEAARVGITLFSSPFDSGAVDLLEELNYPAYKVASAELIEHELIRSVAKTQKPVIISTGGASLHDIQQAVAIMAEYENPNLCLLKCTSAYPASYESMNLRTIPHLYELTHVPVGLSDHSLGISVPVAAVALGATFIEKHFMLDKSHQTADQAFSLDPNEFAQMVQAIRQTESALGQVDYPLTTRQQRALYAITDLQKGDVITTHQVKSLRPGGGIAPRHLQELLGLRVNRAVKWGEPLQWDMFCS
ncbi:MAG: Pseudaminic acid synthase [Candidatus Celerinatantimonas neptuna]|nr:MAG: Pseudaminic acid synthase [Candidatus Celerinatantimonas neptuna]